MPQVPQALRHLSASRWSVVAIAGNALLAFVGILYLEGVPGRMMVAANLVLVVVTILSAIAAVETERRLSATEHEVARAKPVVIHIHGPDRWRHVTDPDGQESAQKFWLEIRPDEHGKAAPQISSASFIGSNGTRVMAEGTVLPTGTLIFRNPPVSIISEPDVQFEVVVGGV